MRKHFLSLLVSFLVVYSESVLAQIGFSIGMGNGTQKLKATRVSVQSTWRNWLTQNKRIFNGYWEIAYTNFNKDQSMKSVSVSGVIRLTGKIYLPIYVDLGLGVSRDSRQEIAGRQLGSNLLFEERVGIGTLLGSKRQLDLGYRLMHFSNGYLAQQNHGLNVHLLVLGYWF